MKNYGKKAIVCALAGFFALGGIGAGESFLLPAITLGTHAEAAAVNDQWATGRYVADGYGVAPAGVGGARGKLLARRAAIVDAQRALVALIYDTQLDAETTVMNQVTISDTTKIRVSGVIRGARILHEEMQRDGTYHVQMELPLYGAGTSVAAAVLPSIRPDVPATAVPQPVSPRIAREMAQRDAYTGVIIDADGMGLKPSFSPVIYDTNGRAIYGISNINYDDAIAHGMVGYAGSLADARSLDRIGTNPIVVKAVEVRGGSNSVNLVNVVVTPEDGDRILAANAKSSMLTKGAVVFIR